MTSPTVVSLCVVLHEGKKFFAVSKAISDVGDVLGELPHAYLYADIFAGVFGSWCPFPDQDPDDVHQFGEDVGSACLLYRGRTLFDVGQLEYWGSQENGYHVVSGFPRVALVQKSNYGPRTDLLATWFEPGDELMVIRFKHPRERMRQ